MSTPCENLPDHEFDKLKQDHEVVIVMVPFLAHGHLNQLLQLACLISTSYDLPVYFVGSANHNHQARVRANALNPSDIAKISFHDIPTPEFASPPPTFNALSKFPLHHKPLWDAYLLLREPIASFLRDISSKSRRVIVVHDYLMSYNVQDVSSLLNAESYVFNCISAFTLYCSLCFFSGKSVQLDEELLKKLPSLEGVMPDEVKNHLDLHSQCLDIRSGDIHNTSKVIEGEFLDLLVQVECKQQWAIEPVLPTKFDCISNSNNICLEWLNKQPPRSVLYISFGTSTTFSDKGVMELAMGLEQSKQKFIWMLREADREYYHGSITMGVPIAVWPMHSDQPRNGFLVTEILKIGLTVKEWEKREEIVCASTFENVVRKLMESEEGDAIRKRAEELGEAVRRSTEKGGSSSTELDSFIAHITR